MTTWLRMVLVLTLVGGGFAGFSFTLAGLFSPQIEGLSAKILAAAFLGLYGFVVWAGLAFVHDPTRRSPLYAALGLQAAWISTPLISYHMWSGALISVGLHSGTLQFVANLGASWYFSFGKPEVAGLGLNLFAIALLVLLYHADRIDDEIRRAKLAFD